MASAGAGVARREIERQRERESEHRCQVTKAKIGYCHIPQVEAVAIGSQGMWLVVVVGGEGLVVVLLCRGLGVVGGLQLVSY